MPEASSSTTSSSSVPVWETTLRVTVPASATLPPPASLPTTSVTAHALPSPKATAPVLLPDDPLSSKAEVKAMAEPTSLYGPLLEVMGAVRQETNDTLTQWKEWEDEAVGMVANAASSLKSSRKQAGGDDDGENEDEEED